MNALSGGRDLVLALGRACRTRAAARTARRFLFSLGRFRCVAADRRREHVERNRFSVVRAVTFGILTRGAIVTLFTARTTLAIEALAALRALRTLVSGRFFACRDELLVTFVFVKLVLAAGTLFFEA